MTFQFEDGMTWEQFVNSKYNSIILFDDTEYNFACDPSDGGTEVFFDNEYVYLDEDYTGLVLSDTIIADHTYYYLP